MSANASGARTQSQLYWLDPYWRDALTIYGMQRDFFYCPTNPRWNREDFWYYSTANPATSTDFVVGNFYFGSSAARQTGFLNSMVNLPKAGKLPVFARRSGAESQYPILWADLNRTYPDPHWLSPGDPNRHGGNHMDYGGFWPRMSHEGRVDNSVADVPGNNIIWRGSLGSTGYHW